MSNRDEATAEISFRQTGRIPELWDAETGTCAPAEVWREEGGRTHVSVPFTVCGSKFVIFRKPSAGAHAVRCVVASTPRQDPPADTMTHLLVIKRATYGVKPPFRIDITEAATGAAPIALSIRVANLWANRLIGDDREHEEDCTWRKNVRNGVDEFGVMEIPQWVKDGKKSPTGRCTFTTWKHWDKNDVLQPSGILGPVYLRTLVPAR